VASVLGLLISALLGTWLAFGISRPVREVTEAIYSLATEQRREPIQERGPEEIRSQARAVNFLVEELHSLETSRRQLLANIVHELGRPLGALRSAIHALSKGAADDPKLTADLTQGMDEETSRLQYLLDELANLYDKAVGGLELDRKPVQAAAWLRSVLISWKAAAQEKRLVWQEEIPESLSSINIDAVRMAQVVGNLLSNAIKYTPTGGTVKISAGMDEKIFWLKVSDTGAGVQVDEHEKIFQPFYRGNTGRRIKQGMGLGLTIARELVIAHGGELQVESDGAPGKGSTFTVTLPL
jgi:signal transduction histidine kinase